MVYYGLLLFFLLEYIRPGSYVPALNVLHLNSIVPLAVLMGSLLSNGQVKISEVLRSVNARWIMFLLLLIVISGVTCDVKIYALDVFERVFGYWIAFIILKKELYDLERVKGVLTTLVLVHIVIGALTPELFSGDGQRHYIASGSFLGDGNDFALSVNIAIPFCLFLMLESQSRAKKLFYAGMLMVLAVAMVATQSRGGVVALACSGLYLWLKSDRKMLGVVGIGLMLTGILVFAPGEVFKRLESLTGDKIDGSAQGRLLAWGAAVRMATDHPLLGVGAGHFPVKYGAEYRPPAEEGKVPWQTAHSSYFLILGELGVPGITFLLGIIVANLMASERTLRQMKANQIKNNVTYKRLVIALNASLIGFAVGGAFLSAAYFPHIFILAALLECGRDIYRKSLVSETASLVSEDPAYQVYGRRVPV